MVPSTQTIPRRKRRGSSQKRKSLEPLAFAAAHEIEHQDYGGGDPEDR